jgi:hypothetical protein
MNKREQKRAERAYWKGLGYKRHEFWIKPHWLERIKKLLAKLGE